jgi:hypothetical protein
MWYIDTNNFRAIATVAFCESLLVVFSLLIRTVDEDAAPTAAQLVLDRSSLLCDRHGVGVVARGQQRETVRIVKPTNKVDGLNLRVKAFKHAE